MLILKDRVLYQAGKLYVEYTHKGDIDIYTLMIDTLTGEHVNLYAHGSKRIIDFVFDAVVAALNTEPQKAVDMDYIISNAYE